MLDIIVYTNGKLKMRFTYKIIKQDKSYKAYSTRQSQLHGEGRTENDAFSNFITAFFEYIKACMKNNAPIIQETTKQGKGTFGLPLNMSLKIKLYTTMLENNVSQTDLARLLALTQEDIPDGDWRLEKIKNIAQSKKPKYKNVQRLFDINHDSTIKEIEQAYRVLGYNVTITPYKRVT